MTLTQVLNAALYAALLVIIFKILVIMFKKSREAFYVAPEPQPFDEDEDDEVEASEETDAIEVLDAAEKVQCPYCGLKVIAMPEVDDNANCSLCQKNVMQ